MSWPRVCGQILRRWSSAWRKAASCWICGRFWKTKKPNCCARWWKLPRECEAEKCLVTSFRAARPNRMRTLVLFLGITATAVAQQMPREDAIRVAEFFRLSAQIQDTLWPEWSKTPSPLLLVTADREFLTRSPAPPKGFTKVSEDLYTRARVFNPAFLATFPA